MDITLMLTQLRAERELIEEAILALERMALGGGKRRGRPPKWMTEAAVHAPAPAPGHKRVFSAATRKKMALAQRRRWKAAKQAKASAKS